MSILKSCFIHRVGLTTFQGRKKPTSKKGKTGKETGNNGRVNSASQTGFRNLKGLGPCSNFSRYVQGASTPKVKKETTGSKNYMKKTINLYLDMEFTSLSPDAQPISIGIVSDSVMNTTKVKNIPDVKTGVLRDSSVSYIAEKSFYAEFDDFDLSRCDDWVKENVVGKLLMYGKQDPVDSYEPYSTNVTLLSHTAGIKQALSHWFDQFSDFNIQFVVDCGTFDWYWLLQLLAEWEEKPYIYAIDASKIPPNMTLNEFIDEFNKHKTLEIKWFSEMEIPVKVSKIIKTGLPKLPGNVSPVPQDLNDLIAFKKGISAREAFDLNREELALRLSSTPSEDTLRYWTDAAGIGNKHNALWDAKVIKSIFNKLTEQP